MAQGLRKLIALAGVGVVLLTSCGGSDESSNRQRNSALTTCSTVTAGEPKATTLPTGGYDVGVTVELCETASSFAIVAADGSTSPVQIGPDGKGAFQQLTFADRAVDVTIRLIGPNDAVIGDEVISLSLKRNEEICNLGGPCKNGDVGPGGGTVVSALGRLYEYDKEGGPLIARFPKCTLPDGVNAETATPFDAGLGKANTEFLIANCGNEGGTLFKVLADFNSQRAFQDWVIPTVGDLEAMFVGRANSLVAHVRASGENSDVLGLQLSNKIPTFVQPDVVKPVIPIRYVQLVPEFTVSASVAPSANQPTDNGGQGGEGDAPSEQPSGDTSGEATSAKVLPNLDNFKVSVDKSAGTWNISFDYNDAAVEAVDALNVDLYKGSDLVNSFTVSKTAWISEGNARRTPDFLSNSYDVGTEYIIRAFTSITKLVPYGDGNNIVTDRSEVAIFDATLNTGASDDKTAPRTPKDLRADETNPLTVRWTPDRESTVGYEYALGVYPYMYILYWREKSDNPVNADTFIISSQLTSPEFTFEANILRQGVEYEFMVTEVHMESNPPEVVSAPTELFVHIPYPVGFEPPTSGAPSENSDSPTPEELADFYANCAKSATLLNAVNDDHEPIESGITSDDRVLLAATHECATSPYGETTIYIEWKDPNDGSRKWYVTSSAWIQDPIVFQGVGRLKAGEQTFYAQARWDNGSKVFFTPRTKLTLGILPGTKPFSEPCKPEDVSLQGDTLKIDCEKVADLSFESYIFGKFNVNYVRNSNELDVSNLEPGWNKGSMWVSQNDSYIDHARQFTLMLCRTECDDPKVEKEFTIEQKGDSVVATVNQNDCGGDPEAELEEFFKLKGNVYYSYNRYFNDEEPELKPGKPLTLDLQPATAALLTERDDYCDIIEGQRKYSLLILDRTPATNPPAEAPTAKGATVVELTRAEVGAGATAPIVLSPDVTTVVIGPEAMAKLLSGTANGAASVGVSVDGGPFKVLAVGESNDITVGKKTKKITFRVTSADGTSVLVDKTITRPEFDEVEAAAANQGQQVSTPVVVSTGGTVDDSGSSPIMYIAIAALLVIVVLGGGATVVRRRKS